MTEVERQTLNLLSNILCAQNLQLQKSTLPDETFQKMLLTHLENSVAVVRNVGQLMQRTGVSLQSAAGDVPEGASADASCSS